MAIETNTKSFIAILPWALPLLLMVVDGFELFRLVDKIETIPSINT